MSIRHKYNPDEWRVCKDCGAQGDLLCTGILESGTSPSEDAKALDVTSRERPAPIPACPWCKAVPGPHPSDTLADEYMNRNGSRGDGAMERTMRPKATCGWSIKQGGRICTLSKGHSGFHNDKPSEKEIKDMLRLRKALDPDAPDAVVVAEHYYCDEGTDEDPTPVHRCNQSDRQGRESIERCETTNHALVPGTGFCKCTHVMYDRDPLLDERKTWALDERPDDPDNPCAYCGERMPVNELTALFGTHFECFWADEVERRKDAVADAAVEWHQAGREGAEWFDKAEILETAIDSLLELRGQPNETALGRPDSMGSANTHRNPDRKTLAPAEKCDFVFTNSFRATFPCQRPSGHRGAHSITVHRGDSGKER